MSVSHRALLKAIETEQRFGTDILLAASGRVAPVETPVTLEAVQSWTVGCARCRLSEERTNIVFGEGNPGARVVFVGEGPGADEDAQGRPFVGRAGQMLTKIIENVLFLPREEVYIGNVVKCRPPGNRTPLPDECATCIPYLRKQLEIIHPEVIVTLGALATASLLETTETIGRLRGRFSTYRGIKVMPTYHPAYLLRNPSEKRKVMDDIILVREALGIAPPQGAPGA